MAEKTLMQQLFLKSSADSKAAYSLNSSRISCRPGKNYKIINLSEKLDSAGVIRYNT